MKDDGGRGNDLSAKDDEYWREHLTPDEYAVLRELSLIHI